MVRRQRRPSQIAPRLFFLRPEPVFPERGLAREGGVRGGLPAPGLEDPDKIEHLTIRPGWEVVELVDDLLFYLYSLSSSVISPSWDEL